MVFSAGRNNRFGHPAPVVVGRYRDAGAAMFRTDEDGAVLVETDGKTVWVRTWSGRSQEIRSVGGTQALAGTGTAVRANESPELLTSRDR